MHIGEVDLLQLAHVILHAGDNYTYGFEVAEYLPTVISPNLPVTNL